MNKKTLLMILDGWGIAKNPEVSAVDKAQTPFMDEVLTSYPHSKLSASGMDVGLPDGQMGNSEVGHMNIGAGRVVYQDLVKINRAVEKNELREKEALKKAIAYAKEQNKPVHLIGLVSDGGVHSHIKHLEGLLTLLHEEGVAQVHVHAFTDGRDTDPKSGKGFLKEVMDHMDQTGGELASVTGRYYAMDRDKRWERVKLAYDALVNGKGNKTAKVLDAIQEAYDRDETDEFLKPIIHVNEEGQPLATIENGDVVICFNFRTDRGRQITMALTQQDFPEQDMHTLDLYYLTMTNYDDTFNDVKVIYEKEKLENTMGSVISKAGKKQLRIAETEKYPHVTFFFSGGREEVFEGESRILCPSPKVATYDLQPEMSARDIRDKIIPEIEAEKHDFICLNFANPDMVGHTGDFDAAVKACETVDACAKAVTDAAKAHDYATLIIADHGNADYMINDDGSPNTAHTTNLVPCVLVDDDYKGKLKDGKLGDIAPTLLKLMGISVPQDMSGDVLLDEA